MSDEMNVNQGGAGFIPEFNPETQGTGQAQGTQGGVQTTQQPISDAPRDTIETTQGQNTQATTPTAIPSDNTIPRLNAPDTALIAGAPQGPITQAPQPGEQGYTNALMAFTTPGQPPDAAAQAYSAFIAEFPPGSPEYEAMLDVLNFNMTDPNLPESMELFAAAREQIIESGALEENVTGTTGPNSRNALRENRIPVRDLTQSDLESMSPEQLSAYSEAEIQEIIQKFPEYASQVANLEAEGLMFGEINAGQVDIEKAFNLSGSLEEWVINAENLIKGLPDSAEKDTMLGFLSKISAALQEFTELLYALQATDSEKTREFTAAKLDETLGKIEKQRKAMRKQIRAAKKGKEKKKMGVMGKILQGIAVTMLLVVCAFCLTAGPATLGLSWLVMPLLLATAADLCMKMAGEKEGVFDKLFDAVDDITKKCCKGMGMSDKVTNGIMTTTKVITAVVIITIIVGSGAFLVGGADTIKAALFDSGLIKNPIAQMVIGATIDCVVMVCQIAIAIALCCTGIGAPAGAAIIVGSVTINLVKVGQLALSAIILVATIVMTCVAIADAANKLEIGRIKMILNRQLANLEEDVALREMLIELLKKAIKALQDSLSSLSSTLSEVQGSRNSMWNKLTYEMEKLHAALGA